MPEHSVSIDQLLEYALYEKCSYVVKLAKFNNIDLLKRNNDGITILMISCQNTDITLLTYMLSCIKNSPYKTEYVNATDNVGNTTLSYAVNVGNIAAVELLKKHGGEMSVLDRKKRTLLMKATHAPGDAMLKFIVRNDKFTAIKYLDSDNFSALKHAVINGNIEAVEFLLKYYHSPNVTLDQAGNTLLMFAITLDSTDMLQYLLHIQHCDVFKKDNNGRTVYDWAVYYNNIQALRILDEYI